MRKHKFKAMMDVRHTGHDEMWVYIDGIGHDLWHSMNGKYYGNILPDTISEFTGLLDSNKKEIYEFDKVEWNGFSGHIIFMGGSFYIQEKESAWLLKPCLNYTLKITGNIKETK